LTKPFSTEVLLRAIRQAIERSTAALGREDAMRLERDCYASLTPREREVMTLVISGLLNKQVGGELGISEITVKSHRGQVMRKMNADSLPDLVNMGARLQIDVPAKRFSPPRKGFGWWHATGIATKPGRVVPCDEGEFPGSRKRLP
jgi:DNA-binding CsgD family transcriptional regulator